MLSVAALAFIVVACGGNRPHDTHSTSGAGGAGGGPAAQGWSPDSQRDTVMQACAKNVQAPDFCQCEFEQFRDVFKDSPPGDGESTDPRLTTLIQRTSAACATKLPEDVVRSGFVSACVGGDQRMAPYCECAWPALRKQLALADFILNAQGPRMHDAKKAMAKACQGTYPVEVAKASFLRSCSTADGGKPVNCECLWDKIHAKYSAEDMATGISTDEIRDVPGLDQCN